MTKSIKINFIYNLIFQIVTLCLPLITVPYTSRVLGREGIGLYSYTLSITQYFIIIGTLGMSLYGNRAIAYVRDNKKEGDLVVDLDLIMQAISMEDKARIANNLLDIAIGIRDYIYKRIEEKTVDSKNMWVIGLLPDKKEREELANRLNAEVIYMYSTIDECLERIKHDNERVDKELHKGLIENWFAKHKA